MASKIRIAADSELPTVEAINFRIELIKRENPILTPALMRRIAALRLRLPKDDSKAVIPAINPALLVSKSDLDWDGRKPQMYATV